MDQGGSPSHRLLCRAVDQGEASPGFCSVGLSEISSDEEIGVTGPMAHEWVSAWNNALLRYIRPMALGRVPAWVNGHTWAWQ